MINGDLAFVEKKSFSLGQFVFGLSNHYRLIATLRSCPSFLDSDEKLFFWQLSRKKYLL